MTNQLLDSCTELDQPRTAPDITDWRKMSSTDKNEQVLRGLKGLWAQRHLIAIMVNRDFMGRYKGSLLGALWPVLNPMGHMVLYTFLFSIILQIRFGNDPSTSNFAIYLMTALLPFTAFSEALSRSSTVVLESPNLVNRVVFPLEILPVVLTISSLLSSAVSFGIVCAAVLMYFGHLPATILFIPLILFSQIILTAGLTWILASIGVFVRDLSHFISLALSAWMYATPIVYPAAKIPVNFKFLLWANPLAGIVTDYRHVILEGVPPDWSSYACYTTVAFTLFFVGFSFFYKTKKSFADVM